MNYSRHISKIGAAFIASLCVFAAPASFSATVEFTITNSVGADTNFITIFPKTASANADGSYNSRGLPFRVFPNASGYVATNLNAGNYLASNSFIINDLSVAGGIGGSQGVMFAVPAGSGTYPFGILAISGYGTYNYTPGVRTITGTNGVDVTSANGYGDVIISATNFSPDFGYKVAAGTNVIVVTNGSLVTVHSTGASAAALAAITNGFTDIVRSNANIFYGNSNPSNYVTASVTNALAGTNFVMTATNGFVSASVTNGLAGTNYVHGVTNGLVTASVTNGLASSAQVVAATNQLGTSAYQPRTAFQPSSATLSNIAISGAWTYQLAPGASITFATNANTVTIASTASGGSGVSVAAGTRISVATNGDVATVTALSQTNSFTSIVFSNVTDYPTLAIATNIARTATNGLGTAAWLAVGAVQPAASNLTNWSQVATGTVATLPGATNIATGIAATAALNATNALGTAAWIAAGSVQPSSSNLTNWSNVATGTVATLINATNIANAAGAAAALNATNGFSSIVVSNAGIFVGTNDSRAVRLTNTASLYAGKLTNGINLGNAFSSPGTGAQAEQFGAQATASGDQSYAAGFQALASGVESTALGSVAEAVSEKGTAVGATAQINAIRSTAVGFSAVAGSAASNSVVIGSLSTALEQNTVLIGPGTHSAFSNTVAIGSHVTNTVPGQVLLGDSGQTVYIPGNATISGTLTNGQTVLTNLYADRDVIFDWTTNNVWVSGAGTPRANGTYIYGSAAVYTNVADSTFTLNFQNPTWFISSNAVNFYSASSPATVSWSAVSGAASAPSSGYGADLDMRGENLLHYVSSTNLEQRIGARQYGSANLTNFSGLSTNQFVYTNSLPGFQPASAILTNLAQTLPNTNSYIGSATITLTTNSGGVVTIQNISQYVGSGVSNQWRVDATNAVNLASNVLSLAKLSADAGGVTDGGLLTNVNATTLDSLDSSVYVTVTNIDVVPEGWVVIYRASETPIVYQPSADTDLARGHNLSTAFSNIIARDYVLIGRGDYLCRTMANSLTNATYKFQGNPRIYVDAASTSTRGGNFVNWLFVSDQPRLDGWQFLGPVILDGVYDANRVGMVLQSGSDRVIRDVTFKNWEGIGLWALGSAHMPNVMDSLIAYNCGTGFHAAGEYYRFDNCNSRTNQIGYYISGGNNRFTACSALENTNGIFMDASVGNSGHGVWLGGDLNHNATNLFMADNSARGYTIIGAHAYAGKIRLAGQGLQWLGGDIAGTAVEGVLTNLSSFDSVVFPQGIDSTFTSLTNVLFNNCRTLTNSIESTAASFASLTSSYHVVTNSPAAWPTEAAITNQPVMVSSNNAVYLLTTVFDSRAWGATNRLAP